MSVFDHIFGLALNSFMTEAVIIIETSPLIFRANQWTGFYMITPSVMKELKGSKKFILLPLTWVN